MVINLLVSEGSDRGKVKVSPLFSDNKAPNGHWDGDCYWLSVLHTHLCYLAHERFADALP